METHTEEKTLAPLIYNGGANESMMQKHCREWMNDQGKDYSDGWRGAFRDLERGGCSSGMVSGMIYYSDTCTFFARHTDAINNLLVETMENMGVEHPGELFKDWDGSDPLCFDRNNQNLLAWFAFEETCRDLAYCNGYEG